MLYILIIAAIVILETKIKSYMDKHSQPGDKKEILNGRITLKKQYNRGMFMSFMEDKKDLVIKLSAVILGLLVLVFAFVLPRKRSRLFKLGLSLCLGGAISNVADRLTKGYVVDYFSFNFKPLKHIVFNLADIFIMVGSLFILISSLFSDRRDCINDLMD